VSLDDRLRTARTAAEPSDRGEGLATLKRQLLGPELAGDAPARVGRFELRRVLGRGAMGIVYEAFDPQLLRSVALKLLLPAAVEDETAVSRLRREARAMAALKHPHVLQVYDVGQEEFEHDSADGQARPPRPFIAMEHAAQGTLRRWLEQPHALDATLDAMLQAGSGIAAAHRAGLVHRDIKPSNILQTDHGVFKVGDFGLVSAPPERGPTSARGGGDVLHTRGRIGTPAYMAPEVKAGHPPTAASDQYSFCVVLHEALYGVRPGDGSARVRGVRPCPAAIDAVIARGLAPRPEDRFGDMDALLTALRNGKARARGGHLLPWVGWPLGSLVFIGMLVLFGRAEEGPRAERATPRRAAFPVIELPGIADRLLRSPPDFRAAARARAELLSIMRAADGATAASFPDLALAFERRPQLRERWFRARHAFDAALGSRVLGQLPTHALSHGEETHPFVQLNLAAAQLSEQGLALSGEQRTRARALGERYMVRGRALSRGYDAETSTQRKLLDEAQHKHEIDLAFRALLEPRQRAALALPGGAHVLTWDLYGAAELLAPLVKPVALSAQERAALPRALAVAGSDLLQAAVRPSVVRPVLERMALRTAPMVLTTRAGQLRITVDDALAFGRSMEQTRRELLELLPTGNTARTALRSGADIPVFYQRGEAGPPGSRAHARKQTSASR
jgi:serine/threonine protein kinase